MRLRTTLTLLVLLPLAACKAPVPPTADPKPSHAPATAKPSVAPVVSAPSLLVRPKGEVSVLSGTIKLDANHIVAQGGGNLISNDGASVISNDGASAAVTDGNAIISSDGASLITNDGGSIISTNGSGIISTNGSGIISTNGSGYVLLAAAGTRLGTELPVVGAQVAVRSLTTGKLLEIGQDKDGKPVTTIRSNANGAFTCYLPKDQAQNVRVETALPASAGAQRYNLLSAPQGLDHQLDEDSQLVTAYMEEAYTSRFFSLMTTPPLKLATSSTLAPFVPLIEDFQKAVKPVVGNAAKLQKICAQAAHILLAQDGVLNRAPYFESPDFPADLVAKAKARNAERKLTTAFDTSVDMLRGVRKATIARMQAVGTNPEAYFDQLAPVEGYRKVFAAPGFHIRYATDFNLFLVRAYLASNLLDHEDNPVGEGLRFNGIARLIEGEAPNTQTPIDPKFNDLFLAKPGPTAAPGLWAGYTGADKLDPSLAIQVGETMRLAGASRAVNLSLLEHLFVGDTSEGLHTLLLTMIQGVIAEP